MIKIVCGEASDSQSNYKEICMMSILHQRIINHPKALQEFTAIFCENYLYKRKYKEL